ncbi:MAG TPA: type III pantothenate kinase [Synergistaceae bacterium]|jgi:type III pantothenate kinase|nr:MAG: Type III pantothenate kinase [Synergistales bacterium 53_16]KUL05448.1 MAG: Type III pantothenate kinase [Synergistales bacterium 54_9]MDK2845564.1 type pantothenate kinase [Synergistales bacterium]HAA47125.1 type III pantothenate kinase [Synergistaceae bacterium]MDN5335306.1 type pantothenate kinase [Synergistales bacterium]
MLLVVDIGNTQTVIGIFREEELLCHWRLMSKTRTADEIGVYLLNLLDLSGIDSSMLKGAILSSVVPPLDIPWSEGIGRYLSVTCLRVSHNLDLGMAVDYEAPGDVGADRLVNSVAGMVKYGKPLIIVDFGTAITLDAVSAEGNYLGGVIAPGLGTSVEALFGKTAKLPKVSFEIPARVIGKNTMESIQSGILHGFAGLVDTLARKIKKEIGEAPVVATGGDAERIAPLSEAIEIVDPWLTLEGLKIIYNRNKT